MDEKELQKLKNAQLQEMLKELGLSTTGKKAELIARLLENETATEPADDDDAAEADEKDEVAEGAAEAASSAAPKKTAPVTAEEQRLARAARFGLAVATDSNDKLTNRAARFGLPIKDANSPVPAAAAAKDGKSKIGGVVYQTEEQIERLKKRQERFGVVTSKTLEKVVSTEQKEKELEAKKKRAARFGGGASGTPVTEEVLRKKKQRAERFGITVEVKKGAAVKALDPAQAAKLAARAAKFGSA